MLLVFGSGLFTAGPAEAVEIVPTAQAAAANAPWLAFAPAPPQAASVCLVDTGVDLQSDTQPAVVLRRALDGGVLSDVDPVIKHGTRMAMVMAAPADGTGMIGAWPALRILSVRAAVTATSGSQVTYRFDDYRRAITLCRHESDPKAPVTVVELAIGGHAEPTPTERAGLENEVAKAHNAGISIVAGSGNDGGPVNVPANTPGIFGVGAADAHGAFCSFSSRGSGIDLLAPGCSLNTANPVTLNAEEPGPDSGGTSEASAFTAAVLAALRSYRPDLSWSAAEQFIEENAPNGVLDVGATFRAAGLARIVDAGNTAMPKAVSPTSLIEEPALPAAVDTAVVARPQMPKPRIAKAALSNGTLTISVRQRPYQAGLHVAAYARVAGKQRRVASMTRAANNIRLRVGKPHAQIAVSYIDLSGSLRPDSPKVTIQRFAAR